MFIFRRSLYTLILVVVFTFSTVAQTQEAKVKVIVNSSVVKLDLGVDQIRRIFSMRQTEWSDSQSISVFVLANEHHTHQLFSTEVLGVFPYQLERIWNKLVYSGLGDEPIKVTSEQEMLRRISQQPGSIGYVLQSIELNDVKIVNVVKEQD